MSNGNSDGPNIGIGATYVTGIGFRFDLSVGQGGSSSPTSGACHYSTDPLTPTKWASVKSAIQANGATYDSIVSALGDDAADFASVPSGWRSSVAPGLLFIFGNL